MPALTLFDAVGGLEGVRRIAHAWHERVLADEVVSHAFSHGFHPDHTERLAAYWSEAWGGPQRYSGGLGTETSVVRMHSGNGEHEEMDRRAILCFAGALGDAGVEDPDLCRTLVAYFTWATTQWLAAYPHSKKDVPPGLGMPQWSWAGRVGQVVAPEPSATGHRPHGAPPVFVTERLLCRRWIPLDIEPLVAVYSDAEAMRFVGDGRPIARAECERWFQVTESNYARRGYGMFALERRGSGRVIGFAGLVHPGGQPDPEIKYALRRDHWGQGFASELVPPLLAYGARSHGLRRIVATVAPGNLASQRVLAKAGMTFATRRANEDGSTTLVFEWRAAPVA